MLFKDGPRRNRQLRQGLFNDTQNGVHLLYYCCNTALLHRVVQRGSAAQPRAAPRQGLFNDTQNRVLFKRLLAAAAPNLLLIGLFRRSPAASLARPPPC